MAFNVTRSSKSLVLPSQDTPAVKLDLSFIDRLPFLRFNVQVLYIFKKGPGAVAGPVIKEALAKALVPYYPYAGRLKDSSQGQLQVDCSGEKGVWLIEANADCTLESVDYFNKVKDIQYEDLLPNQVAEKGCAEAIVQLQVTHFTCGGLVLGHSSSHCLADGLGGAQFINAVGEFARGFSCPSIIPVWHRDFIVQNQKAVASPNVPPPKRQDFNTVNADIDILIEHVNKVKHEFHKITGKTCTVFEVVAASLWKYRTEAINFPEDVEVMLYFFANGRNLTNPPLPKGFYGNCVYPLKVTASSNFLIKECNVIDVVKLIQKAKDSLPAEFEHYIKNCESMVGTGLDPFAMPHAYTTLFLTDWGRVGLNDVDFGWGKPMQVAPYPVPGFVPFCIVGSMPLPAKGVRLMTWCVDEPHRQSLLDLMKKMF